MKFNHGIIQLYLSDEDLETSPYSWIYDYLHLGKHIFQTPDPRRKEVVKELNRRLVTYDNQLFFNSDIISSLFKDLLETSSFTIYPIVGATSNYDCVITLDPDNNYICIIDLLQFAQYGPEIDKMMYVLRSAFTKQMVLHFTSIHFPMRCVHSYQEQLIYLSFKYGIGEYLAWGESANDYQLSTDKYSDKKEFSKALFHQALQEEDPQLQVKLKQYAIHNDFWKRFGVITGLFVWEYLYHHGGKEALIYTYQKGWKSFLKIK